MNLKNTFYNSHIYNVYVRFYCQILWFYKDFNKNKKSLLSSRSKNTGSVTRDRAKSSQVRNETPLQL